MFTVAEEVVLIALDEDTGAKGQAVGPAVRKAIARTKGAIAAMAASG